MLIDWITAHVSLDTLPESVRAVLRNLGDRIMRFDPQTGETVWEVTAWDSVRSDSHTIAFRVESDRLRIQGSPARVVGDGCNVFGAGPVAALDLAGSLRRMVLFLSRHI